LFNQFTGITANTISATTYQNLPTDIRVTGGTYSNGTATFTNNTGGTFNVTGFISADTFTTGFTYSNNIFTISQNQGQSPLTANISTMTGLTINGNLTVTGSSQLNGQISSLSFTGTTDRVVESDSSGNLSAARRIIPAYLTGGTATSLLDNTSNWSPTGVYTGTSITNTFQGQKHYNSSYFFEAVADNFWIRLGRV